MVGKLGIVTFAPWVALIGFDVGVARRASARPRVRRRLWLIANHADDVTVDGAQIGVRGGSLVVLALGSALAGRRLRASEEAQRARRVAAVRADRLDARRHLPHRRETARC